MLQLYSDHCPSKIFLSAYHKTFKNILLSKRRLIFLRHFSIWICNEMFLLNYGLKSNLDMILAGELQFYQLQKSWLYKTNWGSDGIRTHATQILIGRCYKLSFKATRYDWGKFRRFIFFLEKTYAFCNEINQIEPWQTQVS